MKTTCLYCEKEYDTMRDSSAYCSNSCRTGAYKLRKKNAQKEAERQEALKAQKVKDDQQKKLDDEKRKENADKRRKAKEGKALKAVSGNVPNTEIIAQQDSVTTEPEVHIEVEQEQPENLEQKGYVLRPLEEIKKEIESKRRMDESIQKSNRNFAGWIIAAGITYKILDSIINPPKNGPPS
jgi:hypothetical protein